MISKLTFERKYVAPNPNNSHDERTWLDFIINGKSLAELLGGVRDCIGKFGWKKNKEFELEELKGFQLMAASKLTNGLASLYVCAMCGDEGCGALMFRIEGVDDMVKWDNFFWSNGEYSPTDVPPKHS